MIRGAQWASVLRTAMPLLHSSSPTPETGEQEHPYFEVAFLDALRASPRRPLLEMRNPEAPSLRNGPKKERPSIVLLKLQAG